MFEKQNATRDAIRAKALSLGFDGARFTDASLPDSIAQKLTAFIDDGRHGDMGWLETRISERAHPRSLWAGARSVIILTHNYGPDIDPMTRLENIETGIISVYALNKDYHDTIKKKLKHIGRWMAQTYACELKVFVDTAPVMEKPLAEQAGAGWQGKHTNLVSREFGSWLFLGAIYTDLELAPDEPETDNCGSCQNCLDVCPTSAFPAPYQLDARRCISYLTIEHKGQIPEEFRAAMGNRIYGCDDCLAVCPWNKFAQTAHETAFHPREDLRAPLLSELSKLDDTQFRKLFSGSPVKRIGRERFIRNVAIAIGNTKDAEMINDLTPLMSDESAVVRGAAVWAAQKILPEKDFAGLRNKLMAGEGDASVIEEWLQRHPQTSTVT